MGVFVVLCLASGCAGGGGSIDEAVSAIDGATPGVLDAMPMAGAPAPTPVVPNGDDTPAYDPEPDGDGGDGDVAEPEDDADEPAVMTPMTPVAPMTPATPAPTPGDRTANPDNPAECPAEAPADPWGPCAGLPVYVQCNYTTYHCICDWIHWICV